MKKALHRTVLLLALVALSSARLSAQDRQAYAEYIASEGSLTFYYDTQRDMRTGVVYDLNEIGKNPDWYTDGTNSSVTTVTFNSSFVDARPTTLTGWFEDMRNLTVINNMQYLNTSQVKYMYRTFHNCTGLKFLNLSTWDTSNVIDMSSIFYNCNQLTSLNLNDWDTGKVENMSYMFYSCAMLPSLNVMNWDTSSVTNMYCMFASCYNLSLLVVRYWDTSNVTNMSNLFSYCQKLKALEVKGWNTSKVTNMNGMFNYCKALTEINLEGFNTAKVTKMEKMFYHCENLSEVKIGSKWNTSVVTTMNYMFEGCSNLKTIFSGSNWQIGSTATTTDMFKDCTLLKGGNGTSYDSNHTDGTYARVDAAGTPGYLTDKMPYAFISNDGTTLTFYYDKQKNTRTGGTTTFLPSGQAESGWYNAAQTITTVTFDSSFADARPTSTYGWFLGMRNLEAFRNLENLNTSEVTNMGMMFAQGLSKITNLDLSSLDTRNVTDMYGMFNACGARHINLRGWDTGNVTDMSYMFYYCSRTITLDLRDWDVSKVTTIEGMFSYCSSLTTIYADDWFDLMTSLEYYNHIFSGCTSLVGGRGTKYDAGMANDNVFAIVDYYLYDSPGLFTLAPPEPGNLNNDGEINVSDVTGLVSVILGNDNTVPNSLNHKAADVNGDGEINVSDVTAIVSIILNQ